MPTTEHRVSQQGSQQGSQHGSQQRTATHPGSIPVRVQPPAPRPGMRPPVRIPRQAPDASISPAGRCHRCGAVVIGCEHPEGGVVAVNPVAVPGGELIVNASVGRIVQVLTSREASAAQRRGDLGFVPHARSCRR